MRLRQLSIRYFEVTQKPVAHLIGDPWMLSARVPLARPEWRPPVDYSETTDKLAVKVEVAGMSEEQFEVLLYQDVLVIRGERPWHAAPPETRFHLAEIRHGPFQLELPIPSGIDLERVAAHYERGFLIIDLPKGRSRR
jgi:HSP20 family molecular chaperone IbpA